MLADAHRQAAEDIEKTIVPLQAVSYAARVVIEGSWGAAFHWIAFGCETKHHLHLDSETQSLVKDIIDLLIKRHPDVITVILYGSVARHEERPLAARYPSDVDLLVILDSDDPHIALRKGDALFHTLGLAYTRHLDVPREVQVMFSSRTLEEWDPTFVANVMRDGIILYSRGPLPASFAA